ncbi:DNA-binding protein [Butyribacter intestini]|uniref:Transposase n=1 Tax=Butyribacter intestini TaxID=1703332 RepID=A0AAW3JSW7_9FIRM|nr:transposase [Butyribacter intestini]RHU76853.1 DNA-binding protein [Butyribacter intestini]
MDGYITINEVAEKWEVTPRRVRAMCLNGQIGGAAKLGREWAIPTDAERSQDGRIAL